MRSVALCVAFLFVPLLAHAQARHERAAVKPWRDNGKLVGAILRLTLRPAPGYNRTRIGFGSMNRQRVGNDHRAAASDPKVGYLYHQFPEVTNVTQVQEVELQLRYGDNNTLRGGEAVDVITAWNNPSQPSYWHVWGMQTVVTDSTSVIRLPTDRPDAEVTFKVRATTKPGEHIRLAGSAFDLGIWDTNRALEMKPSNCAGAECDWTATVKLPHGEPVELKFVKMAGTRVLNWETGGNQNVTIPAVTTHTLDLGRFR